jgi:hypothetical protein
MLLSFSVQVCAPARSAARQKASPASSAAIDMLNDQPIFRPE